MDETTMEGAQGAGKVKEALQCIGQDVRRAASGLVEGVGRVGKKTREQGGKKFGEMETRFEGYVQRHPLRIIAAAVGTGLALGWLVKRNNY